MSDFNGLLPELQDWNDGRGISAEIWLEIHARSDLLAATTTLFWPSFVEWEGYVFREGFSEESARTWRNKDRSFRSVEGPVNTVYVDALFDQGEDWTPLIKARAVHIVRVLGEIYETKLKRDFPDRRFIVEVWDGSQPGGEISLSFWQEPVTTPGTP